MSVQALSAVLDHSQSRLSARLVLIAIANHANELGENSFPNLETLGKEAGLSERQVIRAVRRLEEIGELSVVRAKNKPNRYVINIPVINRGAKLSGLGRVDTQNVTRTVSTRERDLYIDLLGSGDKSAILALRMCEACEKADFHQAFQVVVELQETLSDHVIDELIGWTLTRDMKNKPRSPRYFLKAAKSWGAQRGIEVAS